MTYLKVLSKVKSVGSETNPLPGLVIGSIFDDETSYFVIVQILLSLNWGKMNLVAVKLFLSTY